MIHECYKEKYWIRLESYIFNIRSLAFLASLAVSRALVYKIWWQSSQIKSIMKLSKDVYSVFNSIYNKSNSVLKTINSLTFVNSVNLLLTSLRWRPCSLPLLFVFSSPFCRNYRISVWLSIRTKTNDPIRRRFVHHGKMARVPTFFAVCSPINSKCTHLAREHTIKVHMELDLLVRMRIIFGTFMNIIYRWTFISTWGELRLSSASSIIDCCGFLWWPLQQSQSDIRSIVHWPNTTIESLGDCDAGQREFTTFRIRNSKEWICETLWSYRYLWSTDEKLIPKFRHSDVNGNTCLWGCSKACFWIYFIFWLLMAHDDRQINIWM